MQELILIFVTAASRVRMMVPLRWSGREWSEANIDQVRTFTVSVDEETQAMKLTDAQTQEEITLNSIAQQANQPTMSGQ